MNNGTRTPNGVEEVGGQEDSPGGMYIVKRPYDLPEVQLDLPTCMYPVNPKRALTTSRLTDTKSTTGMPSVQQQIQNQNGLVSSSSHDLLTGSVSRGTLTNQVLKSLSFKDVAESAAFTSEEIDSLEERQDTIIEKLTDLRNAICSIHNKCVAIGGPGNSNGGTLGATSFTSSSHDMGGISEDNIDIVVKASPDCPPYSLIFLGKLIENTYSNAVVSFTSHLHSSFKGTVDMGIRSAFRNEKEDANVRFTIIWKNVSSCTMMVTPVNSTAVYNEANIARFLSRLLPASNPYLNYDCLDWNMLVKVDNLLEQADNPKITAFIEQELKTSKIGFLADELTIADLVLFSSVASKVSQGQRFKNIPQNVQKWVRKIEAVFGLVVITLSQ